MKQRIKELALKAGFKNYGGTSLYSPYIEGMELNDELREFAELIIRECMDQVEQAKNSPFVSLDDAKRMAHFVDVTKKKIQKHFGVE